MLENNWYWFIIAGNTTPDGAGLTQKIGIFGDQSIRLGSTLLGRDVPNSVLLLSLAMKKVNRVTTKNGSRRHKLEPITSSYNLFGPITAQSMTSRLHDMQSDYRPTSCSLRPFLDDDDDDQMSV